MEGIATREDTPRVSKPAALKYDTDVSGQPRVIIDWNPNKSELVIFG